jgi:hypothetical protein
MAYPNGAVDAVEREFGEARLGHGLRRCRCVGLVKHALRDSTGSPDTLSVSCNFFYHNPRRFARVAQGCYNRYDGPSAPLGWNRQENSIL